MGNCPSCPTNSNASEIDGFPGTHAKGATAIHVDDNSDIFENTTYYERDYILSTYTDFQWYFCQMAATTKKTQDVETTSSSYATRRLKTLLR